MKLLLTLTFVCAAIIMPKVVLSQSLLTTHLSDNNINITTAFSGDQLTLFGTTDIPGDIIISIRGPKNDLVIRRKQNVLGLWLNTDSVKFHDVFSYYDISSSQPLDTLLSQDLRKLYTLGLDTLNFETDESYEPSKKARFQESLIEFLQQRDLYTVRTHKAIFLNERLFYTTLDFPSSLPIGNYMVTTYLVNQGNILDTDNQIVSVRQVGLSSEIREFAHDKSAQYGILCILAALFSGWLATQILRRD